MDIEYNIDADDLGAFSLFSVDHTSYGKKTITNARVSSAVVAVLFLIVGLILFFDNKWFSAYFFILSMAFIVNIFLTKSQSKKRIIKQVLDLYNPSKGKNGFIGKHAVSITPDKFYDITEVDEVSVHWDGIEQVATTDQYLFIIRRPNLTAFVVPKKAFADDAFFREFAETAKKYHQAALTKTQTV